MTTEGNKIKRRDSEVEAYIFIRNKLEELGWDPRNPARHPKGEVYTQNQALEHNTIQEALGKERPENIVKLTETKYWVIEAKNQRKKLDQAIDEAKEYAEAINKEDTVEAVLISGVAGNDADKYLVQNEFLDNGIFKEVKINSEPTSALLSRDIVERLLERESADIQDFPIDEEYFLSKAESINQILHDGAINKSRRAKVMSALLLSLIDGSKLDLDADALTLIKDINNRVEAALRHEGKSAFTEQIKLTPPASEDNYTKFRDAIVRTIRELKDLNIRSAMNSSTDVLGEFYEVFLKYGNGAKEIGIVLTPRHITNFAADVTDVNHNDIVYDPTCGTGGFLVAAFDQVRQNANDQQIDDFKTRRLFGIDQDSEVLSLAIVNMIFRGDGKSNIQEGNCLHNHLTKATIDGVESAEFVDESEEYTPTVSKALMNPPFSQNTKAYEYIERTLEEMEDGGILFSIVPYPSLVKQQRYKRFRERLLENHTLLSVITLPNDLFYPVGQETAAIIVKKGTPHDKKQNVLWVRALRDGRVKSVNKRLPSKEEPNDIERIRPLVRSFVKSPDLPVESKPKFQIAEPIDFSDTMLELVPEAYVEGEPPSTDEILEESDRIVRESVSFLIESGQENEFKEL